MGMGTFIHNFKRKWLGTVGDLGVSPWLRQPEAVSNLLPYLDIVELPDGENAVLMQDGALGIAWRVTPVGHEFCTQDEIESITRSLMELGACLDARSTLQFVFRSHPDAGFKHLEHEEEGSGFFPQRIFSLRAKFMRERALGNDVERRLYTREVYVCARLHPEKTLWGEALSTDLPWRPARFLTERAEATYKKQVDDLLILSTKLKTAFAATTVVVKRLRDQDLFRLMQKSLFEPDGTFDPGQPLAHQLGMSTLRLRPDGIALSTKPKALNVLSLYTQPAQIHAGAAAKLLRIKTPFDLVLNIRKAPHADITRKPEQMRGNETSDGRRLILDATEFSDEISAGKQCYAISLHVFADERESPAPVLKTEFETVFGGRWHHETLAAPGIWLLSLPMAYTPHANQFTRRERRCLPEAVECYLPVFGGFQGTSGRRGGGILVESRAGDAIYVDLLDSSTAPHYAFVAGTQSGKSFLHALILNSMLAHRPDTFITILDKTTTYRVMAEVYAEHCDVRFYDLPRNCPNLWAGTLDDDRINYNVKVMVAAVDMLTGGKESLSPQDTSILTAAVRIAVENLAHQSTTALDQGGKLVTREATTRTIPNMTSILAALPEAARAEGQPQSRIDRLSDLLQPLTRKGQYGTIFDQDAVEPASEAPAPTLCLYDFANCLADGVFTSLIAMICISEVIRQRGRKENRGRRGLLCIEEAPRLIGASAKVGEAAALAFETFAKSGITAGVIGADPSRYLVDPLKSCFNNAPNVITLPMKADTYTPLIKRDKGSDKESLFEDENIIANIPHLKKVMGSHSEMIIITPDTAGSIRYTPTGSDFWMGVGDEEEVATFLKLKEKLAAGGACPATRAYWYLAQHHPWGYKGDLSEVAPDFGLEILT